MNTEPARAGGAVASGAAPRRRPAGLALALAAALAFLTFIGLGTWQVQRLQWKRALIERVEQRVRAAPVPAPAPERWAHLSAASDEYRPVRLAGAYLHDRATRVQAVTDLGGGYWLMTPLRTVDGAIVLVNRGFIPAGKAAAAANADPAPGAAEVTGLLRMSQPGGGFLRNNDAAAGRWYSRDVEAIAAARGLGSVAPYFIDADAATAQREAAGAPAPVGGLTVIAFHNNHLVYALTWYALALMLAGALWWIRRDARRRPERSLNREGNDGRHDPGS